MKAAKGRVFRFGDNVDTDVIIPARYLASSDPAEVSMHCMEDIDASFRGKVNEGDLIVAGKTAVVAGYGWCGKGVAMRAKALGARVIVTEIDPVKAIEAVMDGFDVMPMAEAAKYGDFFVTVTGCNKVIDEEDFLNMKDGAICCNAGHFDCEVNIAWLREHAVKTQLMRDNILGFQLENGRWVHVLGEGRLVNLACGDGHPAEIMDMSFAVQALCAKYLVEHQGRLDSMLMDVPLEVDMEIARKKLSFLGKEIDTLTEEQERYLNESGLEGATS